ncbi:hypothetical protein [Streptomyces sp. IBSBF 2435]|uniref:hypothetical protein n=1 Tax=Streptomyces sp. IBSBF 2435 TaxID=2903531 RepID=UPI002FDB9AC5
MNGWRPLTERTAEEYARRARPAADSPESEPAGREDRAAERRAEVVDAETRKAIRAGQVAREALREAYRSGGGDAA